MVRFDGLGRASYVELITNMEIIGSMDHRSDHDRDLGSTDSHHVQPPCRARPAAFA